MTAWGGRGEHRVAHHGKKEDGDGAKTTNLRERWTVVLCKFRGRVCEEPVSKSMN
jgi:hypothetical protein